MPKDNINPEDTMDAIWCVDSETSERVLMDRKTNKELARLPRKTQTFEENRPSKQEE